jgi:tRNA threonylcarbamoyl adenosine modification protein (Sua5/YciO/YrdC/YwlC family)
MNDDIGRAAEILRAGGLVAFPTETVYGLGADASSAEAVARLYKAEGRPADHPVIVHFATADGAFAFAREIPDAARKRAEKFWPGPLTMVLKRSALAKDLVTGGQDSVGLRVPSHPVAQALLREFDGGVAAPSRDRNFLSPTPPKAHECRGELAAERWIFAAIDHAFGDKVPAQGALWQMLRRFWRNSPDSLWQIDQFIRLPEWRTPEGTIRFGIPRRLDRIVRMEVQIARSFPDPTQTRWSFDDLR